jgi:hypothetical protein
VGDHVIVFAEWGAKGAHSTIAMPAMGMSVQRGKQLGQEPIGEINASVR